jgi:aminoglycoside phosphotransferase (APT) family kinase protein
MRDVMKTPVPKVVAHSSSSDNPIGAEYIIMEKKKGVRLSERWGKLTLAQRQAFVSTLSQYMVDWTNTSFPMFGGLYFKRDLDQAAGSLTFTDKNSEEVTLDDYAIGPSNNKLNYEYGRSKAEFDKGPCR